MPEIVPVRTRDGRSLHVEHHGTATGAGPTVVLEAGMGASRHMWGAVVPLLADHAYVVAYDRAGLGRSEPASGSRRLGAFALVDDLVDVLDALGDGPFVLVGHSWGGPVVRGAAVARPDRVAGLVLVDQTDEGCDLFFEKGNERQLAVSKVLLPAMARLGITRLISKKLSSRLPEPSAQGLRREDGTVASAKAQLAELVGSTDDLRALRDDPPTLPDVPVTVISGTMVSRMERGRRAELIAAHERRAANLPQGRHVRADRSAHLVPFTEPDLVAAEIDRIVGA